MDTALARTRVGKTENEESAQCSSTRESEVVELTLGGVGPGARSPRDCKGTNEEVTADCETQKAQSQSNDRVRLLLLNQTKQRSSGGKKHTDDSVSRTSVTFDHPSRRRIGRRVFDSA